MKKSRNQWDLLYKCTHNITTIKEVGIINYVRISVGMYCALVELRFIFHCRGIYFHCFTNCGLMTSSFLYCALAHLSIEIEDTSLWDVYKYIILPSVSMWYKSLYFLHIIIPPPNKVGGGVYWIYLVRPSVRPSVCRRHGFRSISQVCFGISILNFICMLMVVIGRILLIFSNVTFKMAAWWPYWVFLFLDSNFSLALNINSKLQQHNTYVYG